MKKVLVCFLVLLLIVSLISCGKTIQRVEEPEAKENKFTLYFGYVDKEEVDEEKIINEICRKHLIGFTVAEAEGGWTDDAGTFHPEETLIYTLFFTEEAKVKAFADEVLAAIEGSAVLMEKSVASASHSSSWTK